MTTPTSLLLRDLPAVVRIELSSKEKEELGVLSLFIHRHPLKLWAIAGHKHSQLVYYVADLRVCIEELLYKYTYLMMGSI